MIGFIKVVLLALLNLLPDSPFQTALNGEIYKLDFLPYLNWFLPFDNCLKILRVWVGAILLYYGYDNIKDFINNNILSKIRK